MTSIKHLSKNYKQGFVAQPKIFILIIIFIFISCEKQSVNNSETQEKPVSALPNILLVIADDIGKDAFPNYTEGQEKPQLPILNNLMAGGITFDNLWTYSVCSPTRASILTGKLGHHTGVMEVEQDISLDEESLHDFLKEQTDDGYDTALIGKWHLSNTITDPNSMGVDYFSGIIGGGVSSYTNWNRVTNGEREGVTTYTTTEFSNQAIQWLGKRTKPWFLWLAYNAPHTPFHLAPTNLHNQGNLSEDEAMIEANPLPYYFSAIEALDTELGRIIESIPNGLENTIVVFLGDNGTPSKVVQSPYRTRRAKGSIFQGGINVPMVIAGVGVTRKGEREDALIQSTDLFSTIAQMAGSTISEKHNSKSFHPLLSDTNIDLRTYAYAEKSTDGNVSYTVRDSQYKLIVDADGTESMYDLKNDPYEKNNLLVNVSPSINEVRNILFQEALRIRK
jgi:arylsulfatase A-like enzyme